LRSNISSIDSIGNCKNVVRMRAIQKTEQEQIKKQIASSIPLDFRALTFAEQNIFLAIAESKQAMNAWEIFIGMIERIVNKKEVSKAIWEDLLTLAYDGKPIPVPKTDRKALERMIKRINEAGYKTPTYTTVVRILNDMVAAGWVQQRADSTLGRAKALYYVDKKTADELKKALSG